MAFTNFYLIAGGTGSADINAGSSIGAAQATTTNGNWSAVTGVFAAASGTPFASTVVGDYASVYVDGATVTTFVGKVTVKTSSTNITVDIATIKYGTAPSTSATARSCTINGSWNTEQVLAAGGLATTTVPQSTKINCTGNLSVAASRTISIVGTATAALWFSGYNTTPGDLDNDTTNSLTKPVWTFSAGNALTTTGTLQIWSGLSLTGNRSGSVWIVSSGGNLYASRMRAENTSSNAAAVALLTQANNCEYAYSYFKAPATATTTGCVGASAFAVFVGCVADTGGLAGFNIQSGAAAHFRSCVCLNNTGVGILATTSLLSIFSCTFSNTTSDGIKWTGTPGFSQVSGCVFRSIGGTAINNASGTNTGNVHRDCNDFYSCGGTENGFGDSPSFFGQTDSSDPVTSSSNLTPVAGSNARNNGFPGIFENETFNSYADIGAVRHQDPAGFTGGIFG